MGIGWGIKELSDKQKEIVAAVKYHRRVFAIGGKRSGKSTACAYAAAKLAFRWAPDAAGLAFAPTFAQLKDLFIEKWKKVAPKGLYSINTYGTKDLGPHILCYHPQPKGPPKQTVIYLRSEEAADRVEGLTVAWAYGEEIQDCARLWSLSKDRLSDPDAPHLVLFGAGIPENGWLEEEFEKMPDGRYDPATDGVWVHCQTADNESYLPSTYLADQLAGLTADEYKQRAKGLFVKASDTIYTEFQRGLHLRPWVFRPDRKVWIGKDFNIDPQTAVFFQEHEGCLYAFTESELNGSTHDHARELVAWFEEKELNYKDPSVCQIIPDATGKRRGVETFDLSSNHDILRRYGFSLDVPAANPRIEARDAAVQWALRSAEEKTRLFFDPSCKKTIRCIAGLKKAGRDHSPLSHFADCVGYVVYRKYPLRHVEPPPDPISVKRPNSVHSRRSRRGYSL